MDEQTKKDFSNVMKLVTQKDMTNKDILKRIIKISETTANFKSAFGKVFIRRIKTILSEEKSDSACIICKKNKALNGIVCNGCMDRYNKAANSDRPIKSNDVVKSGKTKKSNNVVHSNRHLQGKKIYRKSALGTFMFKFASMVNKKILKKQKDNPEYHKPVSGHVFIGMFTIILFLFFLFNLYAGMVMLLLGMAIAFYTIVKKIAHFKAENLILIVLSILFFPLGLVCLLFGIIKKMGYVYENRKYIRAGFVLYASVAVICATLYDIPGYRCEPGIVGYWKMVFGGEFGTRWDRSVSSATTEMIIYIIFAFVFTFFVITTVYVLLDETEEYCFNNGLTIGQAFKKMLQMPVEVLLMFAPLLLFVLCKTESLESGWSLDIDNDTHQVSPYSRFRNGKWESVRGYERRNPDDIINNNLSYRGEHPYDGTNPIRNGRVK